MSKVLAKVKDYAITEEMLNETVEALRTQQHINITSEEQKQDLLDELIARQLVVEDAIESGLTQTEEFQKLYREFVFQHSIGQMFKTINVTDEECEAYYNENKEQFMQKESVSAKHILVDNEELCKEIKEKINNNEITFEEAAKQYSSCPSKEKGGDLGMFNRGMMVPEFEEAAFTLSINEISNPVQTQFGYHLIKVENKKEATIADFESVKNQIIQRLMQQAQDNKYLQTIKELEAKYDVKRA